MGEASILLDLYRTRTRPHLVEPESYWYSIKPLAEQARRLAALAGESRLDLAYSADLGPDLLVRSRHPTVAIVYVSDVLDVANAGFVPAEGRADASVTLRWTDDVGLLSPAGSWIAEVDGFPLVDPCQQWWDLIDLGGGDRAEAADRLRAAILARTVQRSRRASTR